MRDLLTPKQVARAMDVSESSVKRWCDKGAIPTQYTAGGHRRIALPDLLGFVRDSQHDLVHPEALDLPATTGRTARVVGRARDQLIEALTVGNEARCRQIIYDLYLAEHTIATICDDVFAAAFRQIGELWACGAAEVYQERHGCEIALRILRELRSVLPAPPPSAPPALGGAATGDHYDLGTTMVELVLRDCGWNAISLGGNLPFATLSAAIQEQHPKLFWLSCSHIANEDDFLAGYRELHDKSAKDVAFVVGGYALTEDVRSTMKYAAHCDNMQHLVEFSETLRAAWANAADASESGGE